MKFYKWDLFGEEISGNDMDYIPYPISGIWIGHALFEYDG